MLESSKYQLPLFTPVQRFSVLIRLDYNHRGFLLLQRGSGATASNNVIETVTQVTHAG